MVKDRLYLFLSQLDVPVEMYRPERASLGEWLAIVENPQDDPREWRVTQVRMPFSFYSHAGSCRLEAVRWWRENSSTSSALTIAHDSCR